MRKLDVRFGKRRVRGTLFLLVSALLLCELLACGIAVAEECSGTITAEEALSAEDARIKAQAATDVAAMEKLFGADLVYHHSSAAADNKASYIESMRSGTVKYRALRRSDVKVRTYGCLAIITGSAVVDVTNKGEDISLPLRFHSVWVKRPQGVQFVSWQSTRVPPTP